jgi:hypothetical protein
MPLTDKLGKLCNLHRTEVRKLVKDYLECSYQFKAIDEKLFHANWYGSACNIVADRWAITNFILLSGLSVMRKEILDTIKTVEKLYFDSIHVSPINCQNPDRRIHGDEDYSPYLKRDRCRSQIQAKDIK